MLAALPQVQTRIRAHRFTVQGLAWVFDSDGAFGTAKALNVSATGSLIGVSSEIRLDSEIDLYPLFDDDEHLPLHLHATVVRSATVPEEQAAGHYVAVAFAHPSTLCQRVWQAFLEEYGIRASVDF